MDTENRGETNKEAAPVYYIHSIVYKIDNESHRSKSNLIVFNYYTARALLLAVSSQSIIYPDARRVTQL